MQREPPAIVRPFHGLRPDPRYAAEIAAPPYDVVTTPEARAFADGRRYSFFRVSRAEIEFADDSDPYAPEVYARAAGNLRAFRADGVLRRDTRPGYYVYRMTHARGVQTGVAVAAAVSAYLDNRIRKHELTRPAKEADRVRQIDATNAITGPVLLVHRADAELKRLLDRVCDSSPDCVVPSLHGTRHELWAVFDEPVTTAITACFERMAALYIADGHHRSAAAARVAAARARANPAHDGTEPYNAFLAVSFPHDEVTILDYNRLVRDLNGLAPDRFLDALAREYAVSRVSGPVRPTARASFGLYVDGAWYVLEYRGTECADDPVARLDVSVLARTVLEPILGIRDQRTDTRIDFVGGSRGPEAIVARVDSGEMAAGFMLYPTALDDLMAVADAGEIMPPKSTWFEPKLADGLISLPLDE